MREIQGEGRQPIALCEAAMLPLALLQEHLGLRGRDIVWFVDNTAAPSALVKGADGNVTLERLGGLYWILGYRLRIRV